MVVAALDPALDGKLIHRILLDAYSWEAESKGILLHDCQMCDAAPHATNPEMVEKLWTLSEQLVKREFKL